MPSKVTSRVLVIPDAHVKHHNGWAFEVLFEFARKRHWAWWAQIGDLIDDYQQASFAFGRDAMVSLKEEFSTAKSLVRSCHESATAQNKACRAAWVRGNHEARWDRAMDNLVQIADFLPSLEELLGFTDINALVADSHSANETSTVIRLMPSPNGNLLGVKRRFGEIDRDYGCTLIHGQYHNRHASAKHADIGWLGPNLHGHTHNLQRASSPSLNGAKRVGYGCGWMGLGTPAYINRATGWETGFAEVAWDGLDFTVTQHQIHWDGRVARLVVDGELYKSRRSEIYIP
jgi:hypothetical protein